MDEAESDEVAIAAMLRGHYGDNQPPPPCHAIARRYSDEMRNRAACALWNEFGCDLSAAARADIVDVVAHALNLWRYP